MHIVYNYTNCLENNSRRDFAEFYGIKGEGGRKGGIGRKGGVGRKRRGWNLLYIQ